MTMWRVALWGTVAALLTLPAVAMQFTHEVQWGPGDFLFACNFVGHSEAGMLGNITVK